MFLPRGESLIVTYVFCSCPVFFMGLQHWPDLVILDMIDFDLILRMTWLFLYYVMLNRSTKCVTLEIVGKEN